MMQIQSHLLSYIYNFLKCRFVHEKETKLQCRNIATSPYLTVLIGGEGFKTLCEGKAVKVVDRSS